MPLSRAEVLQIATLARIALTDDEVELFREQLSQILDQFDALKELDTAGVPPTGHAIDLQAVMREDEAQDSLDVEDVLRNAPLREREYFRVKAVLEE
jgi:aspartyl-tRNA(Asn)/glutamyl-tRNA(Gln) amidotransferase subunit C